MIVGVVESLIFIDKVDFSPENYSEMDIINFAEEHGFDVNGSPRVHVFSIYR